MNCNRKLAWWDDSVLHNESDRLRVVPIVERAKRERAWKSPHARKVRRGRLSRVGWFSRALAICSLYYSERKWGLLVVYESECLCSNSRSTNLYSRSTERKKMSSSGCHFWCPGRQRSRCSRRTEKARVAHENLDMEIGFRTQDVCATSSVMELHESRERVEKRPIRLIFRVKILLDRRTVQTSEPPRSLAFRPHCEG